MISAIVITLNEERNIEACIQALLKLTDDVHILDSGSSDNTREIANNAGAQVHSIEWAGYGKTKNMGVAFAKSKWILSIDADEVLTDELIEEISSTTLTTSDVYAINILTNYCGSWIKHSGWYPSYKKRLFYSPEVSWDEREVHENLHWEGEKKIVRFQNELLHYSYRTPQDHIDKGEKYAKLGAEHLIKRGKKVSWLKQYLGPPFRFFRMYVLKLGVLDRKAGFLLAYREARMVAWRYQYYRALKK